MNQEVAPGSAVPHFVYDVVCTDACGRRKWRERVRNLVTVAGKTDLIAKYFTGASYSAAWYLGLAGSGTIAASDTLASHPGWQELRPYSGNRPAIAFGAATAGSLSASPVTFAVTASATVAGAFIASVASGTGGILYSAANFTAARLVVSGDTLSITPTVSAS